MTTFFSALVLIGAGVLGPAIPADNIFNARAETPIIEEAITDFQDICLTFMLHESAVSKAEDLKHFNSMIEASGYKKRQFSDIEHTATIMGVYGNSFIRPYTKANESYNLLLRWRQPIEHTQYMRYTASEREVIREMPYGKNNGLSCGLSIQLPIGTEFSKVESEILNYDKDWQSPAIRTDKEYEMFAVFRDLQPIQYVRSQNVDFEESNFIIRVIFDDPASAPKTTKTGAPNPYFDESSNPTLSFVMTRPLQEILGGANVR